MGLRHVLETRSSTPDWDESQKHTGLHLISTHDDVTRFVRSTGRLGTGPARDAVDAVAYCMAEVARNVVQHAQPDCPGVAMAQYFPARNRIQLVICDTGRGVLAALQRNYPEAATHMEAVKLALLPHVSGAFDRGTYSASDNAGLGLFFTKEISWRCGGAFWIVSGDALVGVRDDDESGRMRVYRNIMDWPGTAVVVDIPGSQPVDFEDLLSHCRSLAAEARRDSGRAGVQFADEDDGMEGCTRIRILDFLEDVGRASRARDAMIAPALDAGRQVVLDFAGVRIETQSFIHALLAQVFKRPDSLLRLLFLNCTHSTEEAIRTVAAYTATYRQLA
jgi:anti-sigma regulatory factor (Ser/Thr protein kinase)